MNVMANELKETLEIITLAAGSDRSVDGGTNIFFTGEKMTLFNGDAFIEKPFSTDFTGGVNAELFKGVVDKHGTNEIEVSKQEDLLVVKKKRSISKLAMSESGISPKIVFEEEKEWRKIPSDFPVLLDQCFQLTGSNFNEPAKVCIHIKDRVMEASDGFHFGVFKMKGHVQDDIFIRRDFVKILSKFEPCEYRLADSWICFRNGKDYFLAIRKVDVPDYPNLAKLFESCKSETIIELPDKVISSLERAELFLRSELEFDRYIQMIAEGGKTTISTTTKSGSYKDRIQTSEDNNFSILINPKYLVEMLFYTNKFFVTEQSIACEAKNVKLAASLVG